MSSDIIKIEHILSGLYITKIEMILLILGDSPLCNRMELPDVMCRDCDQSSCNGSPTHYPARPKVSEEDHIIVTFQMSVLTAGIVVIFHTGSVHLLPVYFT